MQKSLKYLSWNKHLWLLISLYSRISSLFICLSRHKGFCSYIKVTRCFHPLNWIVPPIGHIATIAKWSAMFDNKPYFFSRKLIALLLCQPSTVPVISQRFLMILVKWSIQFHVAHNDLSWGTDSTIPPSHISRLFACFTILICANRALPLKQATKSQKILERTWSVCAAPLFKALDFIFVLISWWTTTRMRQLWCSKNAVCPSN